MTASMNVVYSVFSYLVILLHSIIDLGGYLLVFFNFFLREETEEER